MSSSSAKLSDYIASDSSSAVQSKDFRANTKVVEDSRGLTSSLETPNYALPLARAHAAKIAGRVNAARASQEEHENLLSERQGLLDKKMAGTITGQELNRLEYVRWSLDRIEDAKYGQALDILEGYVVQYEHALSEIRKFEENLNRVKNSA